MPRSKDLGIYCRGDETFYYLETGAVHINNTVDRLRNILNKRGTLKFNPQQPHKVDYIVKSYEDAKLESWKMQPVYLNEFVKKLVEEGKVGGPKESAWGR